MHPLAKTVLKNIIDQELLPKGSKIILGISGGPDSLALLHLFSEIQSLLGLRLEVGHINHQLRRDSGQDALFVEKIACRLGLAFHKSTVKIRRTKDKSSVEELARELRLKALGRIAKKEHAYGVVLAHHQDDLAETVLMRIMRGSGLEGLRGMQPQTTLWGARFIRPLLGIRRPDIEHYLRDRKIPFRNDPTNDSRIFLRNRIRHDLLPLLEKEYQPGIKEALARLGTTVAADYDFLIDATNQYFQKCLFRESTSSLQLKINQLVRLPPGIRRMVLRQALRKVKGDTRRFTLAHLIEFDKWLGSLSPSRGTMNLPGGIRIRKIGPRLEIRKGR